MVAKTFPSNHPKKGNLTHFSEKLKCKIPVMVPVSFIYVWPKIHTIRLNYKLWKKRLDEVNKGKAMLSVRQWSGKPYRSHQEGLVNLYQKDMDNIDPILGYQRITLSFNKSGFRVFKIDGKRYGKWKDLAGNDGLIIDDFLNWFKKPMKSGIIIHFSDFRY